MPLASYLRALFVGLAFTPVLLSLWIAVTRVTDLFHFPIDVVAGLVLGGFWVSKAAT